MFCREKWPPRLKVTKSNRPPDGWRDRGTANGAIFGLGYAKTTPYTSVLFPIPRTPAPKAQSRQCPVGTMPLGEDESSSNRLDREGGVPRMNGSCSRRMIASYAALLRPAARSAFAVDDRVNVDAFDWVAGFVEHATADDPHPRQRHVHGLDHLFVDAAGGRLSLQRLLARALSGRYFVIREATAILICFSISAPSARAS
jgi:hypothetical protein